MFTLDTKKKSLLIGYGIATIICIVINFIYSKFGHGVTSNYMTYMFLYPLVIGSLTTFLNKSNNEVSSNLAICGIATLTIGSFIQGILEIAGTATNFQIIYYIVGICLIIFSIIKSKK